MRSTRVLALVAAVPWALMFLLGLAALAGVHSQNIPGYPSEEQLRYYVYLPAGVLGLVVTTYLLSHRYRSLKVLVIVVAIAALVGLPRYLLYYTGGV